MAPATLRRVRLASQVTSFLIFVALLLQTDFPQDVKAADHDVALPWPVSAFLEIDPLVALANALATHALYRNLLWAVILVLLTLVAGRVFCGWICPLGSLNHFFGSLRSETKRGATLISSNRYRPWQRWKYIVLAVVLVMSAFGSVAGLMLDPLSLTMRSFALAILPGLNHAGRAIVASLESVPFEPLQAASFLVSRLFDLTFLSFRLPHFSQAAAVGALFALLLAANLRVTRFWCRVLCPLGALLGVCSRWSLLELRKDDHACNQCNKCLLRCQGADDPIPGAPWRKAECHVCLNCVGECKDSGLAFVWTWRQSQSSRATPELSRRRLVTSLAAGAAAIPVLRSTPALAAPDARLIRPPGAVDEPHFLERCIRCAQCMKVCPTNGLQPTLLEAGLEGLWSPLLVPRVGYCEPNCTLCGQVCPTGAIWQLTLVEKIGRPAGQDGTDGATPALPPVRIGTAFYDRGRCLPWAMCVECIVCEEWCPTSPKAIYLVPADVAGPDGTVRTLRQPYVDPARCTGCGACEYACPVKGRPAIYVTSAGETRAKSNQFLLAPNMSPVRPSS